MEKCARTVAFNDGKIDIRLGNNFIAKRKKIGRSGLNIRYYDPCEDCDWDYGNFDPKTTTSIDAYDPCKVLVISSDKERDKVVLTVYRVGLSKKPDVVRTMEADEIELFGDYTYILRNKDSVRIFYPYSTFYTDEINGGKVFKNVDTDTRDLKDKNSVIVEEVIRSEVNPEVYDTIHYRLNPKTAAITSDVYSELQDRTLNLEQLSNEVTQKIGYYVTGKEALFFEIKHCVDDLAFFLQRDELTHDEIVKKIGLKK